jgi:spore germination cell wall hydrolase CwlJ-like protein
MTPAQIIAEFKKVSDLDLMIALFYGEARMVEDTAMDEVKEYLAIGNVILNRVKMGRWGSSIQSVIMYPKQFSCFNTDDPNLEMMWNFISRPNHKTEKLFNKMEIYARMVINKQVYDFSNGSDHYVAAWLYERAAPSHWMYKMKISAIYGGHIFLKEGKI